MGWPVSTTHTITGSIIGAGAARRAASVRWGVAGNVITGQGGVTLNGGGPAVDYTLNNTAANNNPGTIPAINNLPIELLVETA